MFNGFLQRNDGLSKTDLFFSPLKHLFLCIYICTVQSLVRIIDYCILQGLKYQTDRFARGQQSSRSHIQPLTKHLVVTVGPSMTFMKHGIWSSTL